MRRLGFFEPKLNGPKFGPYKEKLLPPEIPAALSCFDTLLVPRWGNTRGAVKIPKEWLAQLRELVHSKFGLDVKAAVDRKKRSVITIYAHNTVSKEVNRARRRWLDAEQTSEALKSGFREVRQVADFGKLTLEQQARVFYESDVVVMAHGGQMANAIFSRRGTVVIEVNCVKYSHLGLTNQHGEIRGSIPRAFGVVHIVAQPCDCRGSDRSEADFNFSPQAVRALLDVVDEKRIPPGTLMLHDVPFTNGSVACLK